MTRQPSEHLAEIKIRYPLWSIRHVCEGFGWSAHRGTMRVWGRSPDDLEAALIDAERGITPDPERTLDSLRAEYPAWTVEIGAAGWCAEYREGSRLHYVYAHTAPELADTLSRIEP